MHTMQCHTPRSAQDAACPPGGHSSFQAGLLIALEQVSPSPGLGHRQVVICFLGNAQPKALRKKASEQQGHTGTGLRRQAPQLPPPSPGGPCAGE